MRTSEFRRLFWRYVRVSVAVAVIGLAPTGSLFFLVGLYAIFVGDKLIGEVMAGRSAAIDCAGLALQLTRPGVHSALFLGPQFLLVAGPIVAASSAGAALAMVAIGACSTLAQQVIFFVDHNKFVDALARR